MYHWDGPGAIPHQDHLLSIKPLKMLQWTPGAGHEETWQQRWWPLYHKTFDAGKKMLIGCDSLESLLKLKKEFGPQFKQFLINMGAKSPQDAEQILRAASD
jgi:hypothetical protein